jgi:hypothetical protein
MSELDRRFARVLEASISETPNSETLADRLETRRRRRVAARVGVVVVVLVIVLAVVLILTGGSSSKKQSIATVSSTSLRSVTSTTSTGQAAAAASWGVIVERSNPLASDAVIPTAQLYSSTGAVLGTVRNRATRAGLALPNGSPINVVSVATTLPANVIANPEATGCISVPIEGGNTLSGCGDGQSADVTTKSIDGATKDIVTINEPGRVIGLRLSPDTHWVLIDFHQGDTDRYLVIANVGELSPRALATVPDATLGWEPDTTETRGSTVTALELRSHGGALGWGADNRVIIGKAAGAEDRATIAPVTIYVFDPTTKATASIFTVPAPVFSTAIWVAALG